MSATYDVRKQLKIINTTAKTCCARLFALVRFFPFKNRFFQKFLFYYKMSKIDYAQPRTNLDRVCVAHRFAVFPNTTFIQQQQCNNMEKFVQQSTYKLFIQK